MKKLLLLLVVIIGSCSVGNSFQAGPPSEHGTGWEPPPSQLERKFFYGDDDAEFDRSLKEVAPELFNETQQEAK